MEEARNYQEELLQEALNDNVIIYLPTGAGKTYIAIMALKEMAKDLEGDLQSGAKRSVFICNTVVLARQQHEILKKQTNLKCALYVGDLNVDNWKKDRWDLEFQKHQVIVATCQIIVDCVRHNYIRIRDFNLIIIDECHNGTGNHPMFQLMSLFQYERLDCLPRVIGLTGVLLMSSKVHTIIKDLKDLEAIYRAKIVTVANMDKLQNVLLYSTKPQEKLIVYADIAHTNPIFCESENEIMHCLKKLKEFKYEDGQEKYSKMLDVVKEPSPYKKIENLLKDFIYQMKDFGLYGAKIACLSVLIELELKKNESDMIALRYMHRAAISTMNYIYHKITRCIKSQMDNDENLNDTILTNSSSKVAKLLYCLLQEFVGKKPEDVSCIIFVQRRSTAKNLSILISEFSKSATNLPIRANFMVGRRGISVNTIENIIETKRNRNVVSEFKRGEYNLIVASSVLEEGMDIQSCNFVISFDPHLTFASYVQRKGRARNQSSVYLMLEKESEKSKLLHQISLFRKVDEELKAYLIGKAIDRKRPLETETNEQFFDEIDAFVTPEGARLQGISALPLLNRYCGCLPGDVYTTSRVRWGKVIVTKPGYLDKYVVSLTLPAQSSIKDTIMSNEMSSVGLAKKSAAFNACKLLYENGELNGRLLPITKADCVDMVKDIYFSHWKAFTEDDYKKAGTNKNQRIYPDTYPDELTNAMPEAKSKFYLYEFKVTPQFSRDEDNSHIIDLLATKGQYAIATKKPLPKLAGIPLFMTYGKVRAEVAYAPYIAEISNTDELTLLRDFHVMLFRDMLKIWQDFFAYDFSNKENSFLIVPVYEKHIDWNLVKKFQRLSVLREQSELQRQRSSFKPEDFENCTINTWYSVDEKTRFVVVKVRKDLTPDSIFPNSVYPTYASYVEDKYKVNVIHKNQFLLEVKPLTRRLNFLLPEGDQKKKKRLDGIFLIPELCHNFQYPGDMWQKASFIPSILHRVHYMLLAEQLRVAFNAYIGLTFSKYVPEDLIVDNNLRRVNNDKEVKQVHAPVFPNPKDTASKPADDLITCVDDLLYKWKPFEEPIAIFENQDHLYKIEIDYYHSFIHGKFLEVPKPTKSRQTPQLILPAICNAPTNENFNINILEISEIVKSPEQNEFLSAITAARANDVFDGERFEILGDSFLKFSISLYLIYKHPKWNEAHLTSVKSRIVSNRNLLYCAINCNLPGKLKVNAFKPQEDWTPPLLGVPQNAKNLIKRDEISPTVFFELLLSDDEVRNGSCTESTLQNFISHFARQRPAIESDINSFNSSKIVNDKVCSDSMEALLGVCLKNYGIQKTFPILNFMGICPKEENLTNLLNTNIGNPRLKANVSDKEINGFLINCDELEKNIGYKFKDRAYLLQALTHPSYPTNRLTGCYQQLEFMGDAILDFLITCYIFQRNPTMDPGKLTDLRSALVNNVTLACLTIRYNLHLFMLYQNAMLSQTISKFAEFQETQAYNITDQCRILMEETGVETTIADYIDVPKALGDIFEAIIAAVFLDCGNCLRTTWNFIYKLMHKELEEFTRNVPIQIVRQLYEFNGAQPKFSDPIVNEDIVLVKCTFTCRNEILEVNGFGKNSDQAKTAAAKLALRKLHKA